MILFETTESVIEILWDVALAIFVARIAAVYFLLNFLSALALSYLVLSARTPVAHLVTLQNPEVLVPFLLGSSILWARVLIVKWEIPRSGWFRLGVGIFALGLMLGVEAVIGFIGYEEGWWTTLEWENWKVWTVLTGWLTWYALMPWALMWIETREEMEAAPEPVVREEKKEKN